MLKQAFRIASASSAAAVRAVLHRRSGRRTRPSWTLGQEIFAAVQQAAWGCIPDVGVVAFRNVAESLLRAGASKSLRSEEQIGGVAGSWFSPPQPRGPVLLYLHGGGYVLGSVATHQPILDGLAIASSWRVFAPHYRLAPEHPRPAAEEDALAVYRALLASGVAASQIVVAGDSAGGNLALVLLLRLRDAGDPLPAGAALVCPWTDLSCSGESFESNADADYILKQAAIPCADAYLAGFDPRDPAVSPLYAKLAGLPPLLIQTGGAETLRDQIVDFSERAQAQGVETQLAVYEDMIHDWHLFGLEPQSRDAIAEIARFAHDVVGRATARPQPAT